MARWILTFDAIDPKSSGGYWQVGIREDHYHGLQKKGHEAQLARIVLVEQVLKGGTLHLYQGWCRPEKDDCFVYEGRPHRDYKTLRIETPAPPEMVFLVFVLPDGTIDNWTWRPLNKDGGGRPQGITGDLIWPQNQS